MSALLFLLANVAAPTGADIQAVEETRVLEPLTDYTQDGRAYVEFAPTVETRDVTCTPVSAEMYECSFETRVKDALSPEFGAWAPRRARLTWRDDCWRQDEEGAEASR
jgi:hypothetical protein